LWSGSDRLGPSTDESYRLLTVAPRTQLRGQHFSTVGTLRRIGSQARQYGVPQPWIDAGDGWWRLIAEKISG
jgi:hypothetical protein